MSKVGILTSIGPIGDDQIRSFMRAGTRIFRQNFSHGTQDEKFEQIERIRRLSKEEGLENEVMILQDLQGPKIRLGDVKNDSYKVKAGDELILDYALKNSEHDGSNRIPLQYNLASKLHVGDTVLIRDGKVRTTVAEILSDTAVKLRVLNDGEFKRKQGVNMIGASFGNDIFPEKDHDDMRFGADKGYEWVAVSFIQNAENLREARRLMKQYGYPATTKLVAKVETWEATKDNATIDAICQEADIVMVARGDMAYEVGYEKVPVVQRKLIAGCRKYGKESIVATQTVVSMMENPAPTRAEADNVEESYVLGANYVMTSEETVIGQYPIEAVVAIRTMLDYAENSLEVMSLDELKRVARYE
ncbi:pyruvate kinase [Candidatus Saccharibacteria bacterium]|nr:pyruvate kinase [Candidatus Saccharibacteria bacterium]MCL1962712.1 pyruvate kinase [Candidatus Saccharibacteria bacterium]